MTRARHRACNACFGVAFLAGLAFVWVGLAALILGDGGAARGLLALGAGFCVWVVLAALGRASSHGPQIGGRS